MIDVDLNIVFVVNDWQQTFIMDFGLVFFLNTFIHTLKVSFHFRAVLVKTVWHSFLFK